MAPWSIAPSISPLVTSICYIHRSFNGSLIHRSFNFSICYIHHSVISSMIHRSFNFSACYIHRSVNGSLIHRSFSFYACYIHRSFNGPLIYRFLPYRLLVTYIVPSIASWSVAPSIAHWSIAPIISLWSITPLIAHWSIAPSITLWTIVPSIVPSPIACIHPSLLWLYSLIQRLYHSCSFDYSNNHSLCQPLILPLLFDPLITPWTIASWPIACSMILLSPSSAQWSFSHCSLIQRLYYNPKIILFVPLLYYITDNN